MPYEVSPPNSTDELSCSGITTDAGSTGEGVRHSVYSWRDGMQDQFVTHDDVSSESDPSDQEPDYSTDQTSPLSCKPDVSVCTDDEEVDDFRDREYPQLRGRKFFFNHVLVLTRGGRQGVFRHWRIDGMWSAYGNRKPSLMVDSFTPNH